MSIYEQTHIHIKKTHMEPPLGIDKSYMWHYNAP